jgi:hypothetical protein
MKKFDYTALTWNELLSKTKDWFNAPRAVTEALKRLKTLVDNIPSGGLESISGDLVNNTDPLNPTVNNNLYYSASYAFGNMSSEENNLLTNVTWNTQNIAGSDYFVSNLPFSQYIISSDSEIGSIGLNNSGAGLPLQIQQTIFVATNIGGFLAFTGRRSTYLVNTDNTFTATVADQLTFSTRIIIFKR